MIVNTAKLMEDKIAGFMNTFVMPNGGLTYDQITEHANSFINDAAAYKNDFTKYALTEEFFSTLAANVAGFADASHGQADAKRTGVGATADVEATLEDLLDNRRNLDRAIKNHCRDNPQKLAEWLTASHIERKKPAAPKPPENNPPTP